MKVDLQDGNKPRESYPPCTLFGAQCEWSTNHQAPPSLFPAFTILMHGTSWKELVSSLLM